MKQIIIFKMKKKTFTFIILLFLLITDVSGFNRTDTLPLTDSDALGLMHITLTMVLGQFIRLLILSSLIYF